MSTTLERFCAGFGNVVVRDSNGKPSIMVRHPKVNSSYFNPLLPDHVHPAFKCGDQTDDAVLIGKYMASRPNPNGNIYSLPNQDPFAQYTISNALNRAYCPSGCTPMTIADFGLMFWTFEKYAKMIYGPMAIMDPITGNVATLYADGGNYSVGIERVYNGILYKCLKAHTPSSSNRPDSHPEIWEKIRKIGGAPSSVNNLNGNMSIGASKLPLTGSGPINWYINNDISLETDFCSPIRLFFPDFRIVNNELQIIPNNLAADPEYTITSDSWKAILPHANDSDVDYVTPGTTGTIHAYWLNDTVTFTAETNATQDAATVNYHANRFDARVVDGNTIPHIPDLFYDLALVIPSGITIFNATNASWGFGHDTIYPHAACSNKYGFELSSSKSSNITTTTLGGSVRLRARELAT